MAKPPSGPNGGPSDFGNPFATPPQNSYDPSDSFITDDPFEQPEASPQASSNRSGSYASMPFTDESDSFGSRHGGGSGGPGRPLLLVLLSIAAALLISLALYAVSPKQPEGMITPTVDTGVIASTITPQADGTYHLRLTHELSGLDPAQVYVAGFMMAPQGESLVAVNEPVFISKATQYTASAELLITRPGAYSVSFYSYSLLDTIPSITNTQTIQIGDGSGETLPGETAIIAITPSPSPTPVPTPSPSPSPSPTPFTISATPTPSPEPLLVTPSSDLFDLYDADTRYYYHLLTDTQKRVFSELYDGVANGEKEIDITPCSKADYNTARIALMYDCPELFLWNYEDAQYFAYTMAGQYTSFVPDLYAYSVAEHRAKLQQIVSEVKGVAASAGTDDYAIELALYEHVINSCYYDKELPFCSYADSAFLYGYAKCTGYAYAFNLALRLCGIPCAVVIGNTYDNGVIAPTSHMWSVVQIDGKWYNCDATWDEMDEEPTSHKYFNINDRLMYQARSIAEEYDLPNPPVCTSLDANYAKVEQTYVSAGSDVETIVAKSIARALDNGEKTVELLFESGADFNTARMQLGKSKIYDQVRRYSKKRLKYNYWYSAEVNSLYIRFR